MWQAFNASVVFSTTNSTEWSPAGRERSWFSISRLNGLCPTMHIAKVPSGERNEPEGHSTNLAKLYKNASFSGYSAPSVFPDNPLGDALHRNQQAMIAEIRQLRGKSIPLETRRPEPDIDLCRFCG
jgi:hypothetical protein